jgi:hypothetical protein
MARLGIRPFWRRAVVLWFVLNLIAFASWAGMAWTHWPWPNYGYCDIPIYSWSLYADSAPAMFWVLSVLTLFVVSFRAYRSRNVALLVAVALTTVAWTMLARHNFVPDAQMGDGCAADGSHAPSNTSLERTREG